MDMDVSVDDSIASLTDRYESIYLQTGSTHAKRQLAQVLAKAPNPHGHSRAEKLFTELIDEEANDNDICELALILRSGEKPNPKQALMLYEQAVLRDAGSDAAIYLAYMLAIGIEVGADYERATELLTEYVGDGSAAYADVKNMFDIAGVARTRVEICSTTECDLEILLEVVYASSNPVAMRALADQLRVGYGEAITPDGAVAMRLLERAMLEHRDLDAKHSLSRLLLSGEGGASTDPPRAKALLEDLVNERGTANDLVTLGELLQYGRVGVERDVFRAQSLYERILSEQVDHFQASVSLALILGSSDKMADRDRALELLITVIGYENADISTNLSNIFWTVTNSSNGDVKAARLISTLLRNAANMMNKAQVFISLARILESGEARIPVDEPAAVQLYEKSINSGSVVDTDSLRRLAALLSGDNEDIPTDLKRSIRLLEKVIQVEESADGIDLCELGVLLRRSGEFSRAVQMFERAIAVAGHFDAMVHLAILLNAGVQGIERNTARATQLLDVAISSDDEAESNVKNVCLIVAQYEGEFGKEALRFATNVIDEQGDAVVIRTLAALYATGESGVTKDMEKAAKLYESAVEQHKDVPSMRLLSNLLRDGTNGIDVDYQRAISLLKSSLAENENAFDLVELAGLLRLTGNGDEAYSLYERAVERYGSFDAAVYMAYMLFSGKECKQNVDVAYTLLENALEEDGFEGYNVEEAFRMGCDEEESLKLLSRVVESSGNVQSLTSLGCMLQFGRANVQPDAVSAVRMYELALARGGDPEAYQNLATILRSGRDGVPADRARAVAILESGVEVYARSSMMCDLAALLRSGLGGVTVDANRAEALYRRAALLDENTRSIIHLALMQERGMEISIMPRERARALLVAAIGDGDAAIHAVQTAFRIINGEEDGDVPMDAPRALKLLIEAVEQDGGVKAARTMGNLLKEGGARIKADLVAAEKMYALARGEAEL